jgi:hypothetical protein
MADLSFKPIGADVKTPKISLADMVGTMKGLQEYKKAKEINPLLVQQQQAVTQQQVMQNKAEQASRLIDAQSALINHPLVVQASQNPASVSKSDLTKLINQYGELGRTITGVPKERVAEITAPLLEVISQDPSQLQQRLKNDYLTTVERTSRAGLMQPSGPMISSGAGGYQMQTNVFGPQPGSIVPGTAYRATISPSEQYGLGGTDITGRPYVIQRSPTGEPIGMAQIPVGVPGVSGIAPAGVPAGGPAGAPAAADGTRPYPPAPPVTGTMPNLGAPVPSNVPVFPSAAGGAAGVQASQSLFQSIGQAAATAPTERQNSNKIIKLADEAITGKGAQAIAALGGGYAALPFTSDATTNLQELGHYMALQTAALSQSTGFSTTDAARGISEEMAGNVQWTAPAIKKTARVNRALSAANELLYDGIRRAAAAQPNNPEVARQYRDQWAQSMGTQGIDAIRLIDAYQNRGDDPEGVQDIIKEFGGVKSEKFKAVMRKADELSKMMGQ